MHKTVLKYKLKGFNLMELLVAMIIAGILITAAMVYYAPAIADAKSMEAQQQLEFLQSMEKMYYYKHSKYSDSFTEIRYEAPKLTSEDGSANYKIEIIEAGINTFTARATAIADFDGDGVVNVWEINQDKKLKEITPD
jgi:type IV pilus assembly protein PilE